MRRDVGVLTGFVCGFVVLTLASADEAGGPFQGEWRTSISVIHLEQKGEAVTGTYGPGGRFLIKGTAKDKVLNFEFEEGQAKGKARFTLDASGNAFTGGFQVQGGRQGIWNGWRPDPHAPMDKPGSYAGTWLTNLGLMELTAENGTVKGRYALRGNSTLEGKATGRRLDFRFQSFRGGQGWFDFASNSKAFNGAGNSDGFPGWFGWNGRPAPEFVRHARLLPGKLVDGSSRNLLTYTVRAPESYQAESAKKWPAVLILHGSNMNGRRYVATIAAAWPDIARDYILLGINGETPLALDDEPSFNYTYVNYMGRSTLTGYPGTDRESPALVSEAMAELKQVYPISHYLVGGHSQGGFLTYSLLMNFPELIAGAFPISSTVMIQCEPSVFADEALRRAQRSVPLAIVHGRNDPLIRFDAGQYAATLFSEESWPAFRFFTDDKAAHMFARLPVGPAIRWLEALASHDPTVLLEFAANRLKEEGHRDAIAALRRISELKPDESQRRRAAEMESVIAAKATPAAAKYLPLVRGAKPNQGAWIDDFLAFRDEFEFAKPAREVMAAFAELRKRHEGPAKTAFLEANQLFRQAGKQDEGYKKYQQIVDSYYAAPVYRIVKRSLNERK
jgi:predicted esterase